MKGIPPYKRLQDFRPSKPVCIDMDGTLMKYHALWRPWGRFKMAWSLFPKAFFRSFGSFFAKDPGPVWQERKGCVSEPFSFLCAESRSLWSAFKWHLSSDQSMDVSMMAYRSTLLDCLARWKDEGASLYLVTGSPMPLAQAVFDHIHLFDGFLSSSPTVHLVGRAKAQALVHHWGVGGFHYIGDSRIDRHVWSVSEDILTVASPGTSLFLKIVKTKRADQDLYVLE
jgi:hypothetical protein